MSATTDETCGPSNPVLVGTVTAVYGVKGWVKVKSYTAPESNILDYQPWWLTQGDSWQKLVCDQAQGNGQASGSRRKALVVHLAGVDDRERAKTYCQRDIYISSEQLADLPKGEYYWHQLLGFVVYSQTPGCAQSSVRLGSVETLLETGANDVLVVAGDKDSSDRRERLIPYIDGVVLDIDPEARRINVDWDPEF